MATTITLVTGTGSATYTVSTGARGPAGADGSSTWSALTGTANHIPFDTTPTAVPSTIGTLAWSETEEALEMAVEGGAIAMGKEVFEYFTNTSGAAMTDGQIVSVVGVSGNRSAVDLTDATDAASSRAVVGMVTHGAANNGKVRVTKIGTVHTLNTDGLTEGGTIYVDPTTPGGWTQTRPTAPNHVVSIGIVQVAHAVNGIADVTPHYQSSVAADITDATATGRSVLTGTPAQANSSLSSPVTNVRHYGATGDGVTDDTAAINLAKTAALSSNHVLYFPAGTYLCNLELTTNEVLNFVGDGADSVSAWVATAQAVSTIKPYSNASPVIWLKYLSGNCLIEGLNILGNGAGTSVDGIKLNAVGDGYPGGGLLIRHCTVRGFTNGLTNLGGTPIAAEVSYFGNCNKNVYSKGEGLTRVMRFSSCVLGGAPASGAGISLVNEGVLYAQFNNCEIGNNTNFFENTGASHCYLNCQSTNFETHSGDWLAKTNGGSAAFRECSFMMSNSAIHIVRTVGSGVKAVEMTSCAISGITTGAPFATDGVFNSFASNFSAAVKVYTSSTFATLATSGNALKYRLIYKATGTDVNVTAGENAVIYNEVVSANVAGIYNPTTGVFAPGKPGYYEIRTSMNLAGGANANVYVRKNGVSVSSAGYTSRITTMPNGSTIAGSAVIYVGTATDTFGIVLTVTSNTTIRTASYHNECFINIVEL